MNIRVSIIIPAFNVENYLNDCVQSCVDLQNADVCELIIVDNNSSDQSLAVAQRWQEKYPRFIQVVSELKKGAGAARNTGLRMAKGEWIQFLDADDLLKPEKIKHQLDLIDQSGQTPSFVAGSFVRLKTNGKSIPKIVSPRSPFLNLLWGYGACGITSSNLWNTEWLRKAGGFDENQSSSQETHLMFSLLKLHPVVLWDKEIYTIVRERTDGSQISSGKQDELTRNFFELRKEMITFIQTNYPALIKENTAITAQIYRSFSIWLLSESKTDFHVQMLSFLIENLYTPWYQRLSFSADARYNREESMRRLRNSRLNHKLQLFK
jgi:glycosyltransferase involved in cell wall biosynthesis